MSEPTENEHSLAAEIIDNAPVNAQQLLVVGLCLMFNMLDGFDVTAMAVIANAVSNEISLTPDKLGWIFSFALAGMTVGSVLLAPLADRVGRRKLMIFSLVLLGLSITLTAQAGSFSEFVMLRFISGLGAGVMLVCSATLAAEYSPEKYRALSVSAVLSGYPLGALMTSVVAGAVLPEFGWRGMFWFGGTLTLAMGIVAYMAIPESLKFLFQSGSEAALAKANVILAKFGKAAMAKFPELPAGKPAHDAGILQRVQRLLSGRYRAITLTLWASFFLCFGTLYFLLSWLPKLVEDAGHTAGDGRNLFVALNLGGVIGIYIMGCLSIRWKLTNIVCSMLVASALGMAIYASVENQLNVLMLLIFGIGVLQQGGFTGLYAAATKLYPTEIRSTGIGWAVGLGRTGAIVGPAVAGYLVNAGFDMSGVFYIFAVPIAIGGAIVYRLHVK